MLFSALFFIGFKSFQFLKELHAFGLYRGSPIKKKVG